MKIFPFRHWKILTRFLFLLKNKTDPY